MAHATSRRATLADLAISPGKAELIGGRIVPMSPTGFQPNQIAGLIYVDLLLFERQAGRGYAFTDNMGFTVPELSTGRQSFSPDAAYFDGPPPPNRMRFVQGPPTFAVEVRSENDYGPAAEAALASKCSEYFEAGTTVVWDVDPIARLIRVYRVAEPDRSAVYVRRQVAEAEPALPGWRPAVDDLLGGD